MNRTIFAIAVSICFLISPVLATYTPVEDHLIDEMTGVSLEGGTKDPVSDNVYE
ncbi:MAG: hypothetical protein KBB83_03555 [Alphaproteobacteria bacterium]|nr:hypothetical protein [Alphaproteobacteria bacterium]